jgi:ABC transporter substrate binding protein
MRRREFITLIGSGAAWPIAARAQQGGRMRRVGVLQATAENDQETQARTEAFRKELAALGWTEGRDILIDYRYAAGDAARIKAYAAEIVSAGPDLILAHSTPVVAALRQGNPVPIVFVQVTDPIGFRRKPGASGRQHHRVNLFRTRHGEQMAGNAQGDRARPGSGRPHVQSGHGAVRPDVLGTGRGRGSVL